MWIASAQVPCNDSERIEILGSHTWCAAIIGDSRIKSENDKKRPRRTEMDCFGMIRLAMTEAQQKERP